MLVAEAETRSHSHHQKKRDNSQGEEDNLGENRLEDHARGRVSEFEVEQRNHGPGAR